MSVVSVEKLQFSSTTVLHLQIQHRHGRERHRWAFRTKKPDFLHILCLVVTFDQCSVRRNNLLNRWKQMPFARW
jgi:hypothetical protein